MRHNSNEDFFNHDTPESFYWAGFIAADGCIRIQEKKYKQLVIGIDKKDIEHLYKFKKAISFEGPVGVSKAGIVSVYISSGKIFDSLGRFGITPRKSLTYRFPKWLKKHYLVNHFMRGYFDGDGSFYFDKRNNTNRLCAKLIGTKQCIKSFIAVLINNGLPDTKIFEKWYVKNGNCYFYFTYKSYSSTNLLKDFLYNNADESIRLDRKYNITQQCTLEKACYRAAIGKNIKTGEIIKINAMKEASDFGFVPDSVGKCCRGKIKDHRGYVWSYDK